MSEEFSMTDAMVASWKNGVEVGRVEEQKRLLDVLTSYFELTRFSQDVEGAEPNPDWDAGFQAAMSFIKGENK